ncbi:hypothetical protein AAMO2058_000259500 [Amorphochlora amoebiformis]|mmetsp:Transcript_7144/g.11086  ORF Transcript_7144/g.11086 Transcript_7144/m.11086 type:complete len:280 (-) Transcript_7144:288-1127(-)
MTEEVQLKLVIVGGPRSGKTALIHRFKKKKFLGEYVPTIGFSVNTFQLTKAIRNESLDICLQIWDVSNVELKGRHLETIFENVAGIMMVVDPSNPSSLEDIDSWHDTVIRYAPSPTIPMTLILTKYDLTPDPIAKSAASILATSLALSTPSSIAKLFGAKPPSADLKKKKSSTGKFMLFGESPVQLRLQDLSPEQMNTVLNTYCSNAGILEWKKCSSKTGKNVKDAVYSLVSLSLQPYLDQRKKIRLEKEKRERKSTLGESIFTQSFEEIPEYKERKGS